MIQADYRRAKVATKLKITYVKDTVLDVRQPVFSYPIFTFNTYPGEASMERLCVFHEFMISCLVLMSTGEEWSNCFILNDISLPLNPYIGLSAMTGDVSDAHEYVIFVCLSVFML